MKLSNYGRRINMPLYEYSCEKCGEKFEQFVSLMDSETKVRCPRCGAEDVQKLFSTFGIGDISGFGSCGSEGSSFG